LQALAIILCDSNINHVYAMLGYAVGVDSKP
jgi:hypothetical protein